MKRTISDFSIKIMIVEFSVSIYTKDIHKLTLTFTSGEVNMKIRDFKNVQFDDSGYSIHIIEYKRKKKIDILSCPDYL